MNIGATSLLVVIALIPSSYTFAGFIVDPKKPTRPSKTFIVDPPPLKIPHPPKHPAPAPKKEQPDNSFKDCKDCPYMVVVPAANFKIKILSSGTSSNVVNLENQKNNAFVRFFTEKIPESNDKMIAPNNNKSNLMETRTIHLKSFAIGKFEVTRAQFAQFIQETYYNAGDMWRNNQFDGFQQEDDHPVIAINWMDAQAYVKWLQHKTGQPYRLLTEAEWAYAAQEDQQTNFDPASICQNGNIGDASLRSKHPDWSTENCTDGYYFTAGQGHFKPNGFGLFDMTGNASEWVEDCLQEVLKTSTAEQGNCKFHLQMGGSWFHGAEATKTSNRIGYESAGRYNFSGFRVAKDLNK